MSKVKLLAPAKNFKVIQAAYPSVDAFYFGVRSFNMRMQADNFELVELPSVLKFLHENGVKGVLATNILIYENELSQLREVLEKARVAEIDAVIINDLAALQTAKELGVPFHVSTQCNVSNSVAALFYGSLGAERIILARECSLNQIREIKAKLHITEVEVFVHGAMCTSISGRCYFSQDLCGTPEKSANRGRCEQPCRRQWWVYDETNKEYIYDGQRFLNSRDLCMITHVPELIEAKVDWFKIEGRMRDPHYVEVVAKTYREAIESYYEGSFSNNKAKMWIKELKKVYNRGFTTGFYFNRPTEDDQQHKSPANLSHWRMIKLGTVESASDQSNTARILLRNGILRVGDEIIVMGSKTSRTYFHQLIQTLKLNGNPITITPPARQEEPVSVEIQFQKPVLVEDGIYLFTDRTYKKRMQGKKFLKKSEYYRLS
jgi:putative protease